MTRPFYISCAINGILAGILLFVCGGVDGHANEPECGPEVNLVQQAMPTMRKVSSVKREHARNWTQPVSIPARTQATYTALSLLWAAESSNGTNFGPSDGGKAYGHFGQHAGPREHWDIGCRTLGVDWPESDRANLARAAAITAANWAKYAPKALKFGNVEMLVRKHRLPNAPMRADNDLYVERVMR